MLFQTPPINQVQQIIISIAEQKEESKEQLYIIKERDTLEKIASDTHTTVQELFNKNIDVVDPNIITVGSELTIPAEGEVLAVREMPAIVTLAPVSTGASSNLPRSSGVGLSITKDTSENLYSYGYCTHFAKQMRPDLPNNLGNADTWGVRAAAQGFTVSNSPTVGSVGVANNYMHVAIVTGIHDGMVDVTEQNYKGWGVVSTRTAPISEFQYIL